MKHLFTLKVFLIACVSMLIGGGNALAQETETIDLTKQGYENSTAVTTVKGTNVTLLFDKGTGSAPKYYTSGTAVRVYVGNTLTISSETFDIEKIVITYPSESYAILTADGLTNSGAIGTWVGKSKSVTLKNDGGAQSRIQKVQVTFALAEGAVAAPTFTPSSGTMFDESLEVTITPADATHSIWYTLDGTDPTSAEPSKKYTAPFTIDATTTVKAIAVDEAGKASSVVSATYTEKEWLNGLSALVDTIKKGDGTAKEYYVNLTGAVVTGVSDTNAYFEEGVTGLLLYKYDHGLTVGHSYSGEATVIGQKYNGIPQITSITCETVAENAELPLTAVTIAELTADYDKYLSRRVKIVDAVTNSDFENGAGEIAQGTANISVKVSYEETPPVIEKNIMLDVIGWPYYSGDTRQLRVWSVDDITNMRPASVFKFSVDAVSAHVDGTFIAPELENTYEDKNVTYSSSNPAVATVDAATGEVTIIAEGETVITASIENGKEATYTLSVKPSLANREGCYYLVTDVKDLVPGARYLIANADAGKAVGWQKTANRSTSEKLTFLGNNEVISDVTLATEDTDADDGNIRELVLGGTTGAWTFYDAVEGGYLYAASSTANQLKTKATVEENGQATIEISDDGTATIKFITTETDRNWLRYNTSGMFSCYASGQSDVQLYKLYTTKQAEFTIGADGYATFYTDKAFVMPQGVEGAVITAATDGKLTLEYNYAAGATVPAKTALLLKGAASKYAYDIVTSEETAPADNLLHGADAVRDGKTFVDGTSVKYYVLSKKNGENLGFYWAEADGAATDYQAGKAFLAVDFGSEAKVYSMYNLDGTTTGINDVETRKAGNGRIYNLTGVCVGNNAKALPKGIYIVNGKKVVY